MSEKVTLAIAAGVDFQGKDEDRTKPPEPVCRQTQINFYFIFWSSEQFGEPSPFTLVQFHTPLPFFLFFFLIFFYLGLHVDYFVPCSVSMVDLVENTSSSPNRPFQSALLITLFSRMHFWSPKVEPFDHLCHVEPGHKILTSPMESTIVVLEADEYKVGCGVTIYFFEAVDRSSNFCLSPLLLRSTTEVIFSQNSIASKHHRKHSDAPTNFAFVAKSSGSVLLPLLNSRIQESDEKYAHRIRYLVSVKGITTETPILPLLF